MTAFKSFKSVTLSALFLLTLSNPGWSQVTHFSLTSSTVALWTFSSITGTTFTDLSSNSFSLSNANKFALSVSPSDSAAVFTGSASIANSYLSHANASALTIAATGKMTYEVRMYLTQAQLTSNNGGWTIGFYDGPQMLIQSNGSLSAGGQKSNGGSNRWWAAYSGPGMVPMNVWVDVAVAWDQTTGQAYGYINGTPIQLYNNDGTVLANPFRVSTGSFFVGNNGQDNYQFRGTIDEIRVSNTLVLGTGFNVINSLPPTTSPPSNLSYSSNPATYGLNVAIANNVPTVSGTVTHYAVNPSLPSGLKLDTLTGIVSGTPTALSAATAYTITASGSLGSTTANLNITVVTAPSGLSYSANPVAYYKGIAIALNAPTVTGVVTSYSVTPSLPAGLTLNTGTGIISGTPTGIAPASNYIVSASNGQVSTTVTVNIAVVSAPTDLSYSTNPGLYGLGKTITANNPTVTGSAPITYSVTPTLPAGLTLNTATGVISGSTTALSAAANYTVTATNIYGTATVTLSIAVLVAPSGFSYAVNPTQYVANTVINPNIPIINGTVATYSVSPALPPGLSINSTTGIISGTPSTQIALANYVVTATNAAGSATITLTIGVSPPVALSHNPALQAFRFDISKSNSLQLPMPQGGNRLEILDPWGRKVWSRDVVPGTSTAAWNGVARNGNSVSPGIYFLRILPLGVNLVDAPVRRILFSP